MTSGLTEKINRRGSLEISQCFPLSDAKYWIILGFLRSIKQSSRLTPLGDERSEPDLAVCENCCANTGRVLFLEFVPVKVIRRGKSCSSQKKLIAEIIFLKPCYVEEGGDEILVSLNTSKDCSRNENSSEEARQSERPGAFLCIKLQGEAGGGVVKDTVNHVKPWTLVRGELGQPRALQWAAQPSLSAARGEGLGETYSHHRGRLLD